MRCDATPIGGVLFTNCDLLFKFILLQVPIKSIEVKKKYMDLCFAIWQAQDPME